MIYPGLLIDAMRWPLSDLVLMYAVGLLVAWISWNLAHWD